MYSTVATALENRTSCNLVHRIALPLLYSVNSQDNNGMFKILETITFRPTLACLKPHAVITF